MSCVLLIFGSTAPLRRSAESSADCTGLDRIGPWGTGLDSAGVDN